MPELVPDTPFRRATWRADVVGIWGGLATTAVTAISSLAEGQGVAVSLLLALAAFPLAFLTCVLLPFHRQIVERIAAFLRPAPGVESGPNHSAASPAGAEPALAELRSDVEKLNGEFATVGEAVQALRFWMAEMSRVHLDAARVVALRRLTAEAPGPPDGAEEAGAETMERFAHAVDAYASVAEATVARWGLAEAMDFPGTRAHAERAAEAELESEGHRLSAAEFSRLRRYRSAVRFGESVTLYLDRQARLAESTQEQGLGNLVYYYEKERPKLR